MRHQAALPVQWRQARPVPARRTAKGCARRPPHNAVAAATDIGRVLCGMFFVAALPPRVLFACGCAKGFVQMRLSQAAATAEQHTQCCAEAVEAAAEGPSPRPQGRHLRQLRDEH